MFTNVMFMNIRRGISDVHEHPEDVHEHHGVEKRMLAIHHPLTVRHPPRRYCRSKGTRRLYVVEQKYRGLEPVRGILAMAIRFLSALKALAPSPP